MRPVPSARDALKTALRGSERAALVVVATFAGYRVLEFHRPRLSRKVLRRLLESVELYLTWLDDDLDKLVTTPPKKTDLRRFNDVVVRNDLSAIKRTIKTVKRYL